MPDREKVIKGFECCKRKDGNECKVCPYTESAYCVEDMVTDALAMLKEQDAVKPFFESLGGVPWRMCCGSCYRVIVETDSKTGKEAVKFFEEFKYCPFCGKGVKFE